MLEVYYNVSRPLSFDLAYEQTHRSLVRAVKSGLVMHHGPEGSEISVNISCGRSADKVNALVCAVTLVCDGASPVEYETYRQELAENIDNFLGSGQLDFSLYDHDVDSVGVTISVFDPSANSHL
jgi:hypothetical protein